MILQKFKPDEYYDSVKHIDFQKLKDNDYKNLLFDIDNTLVEDGQPATPEVIKLFHDLKGYGFKIGIISNNQASRVKPFAKDVNVLCVSSAHKPDKIGYDKIMKLMGTDTDHTCMIGDQLFTDIYGANKLNIHSILVKPISKKEPFIVKIKRLPERILIKLLKI